MAGQLKCGLIGHPLGHSYSPEIHALLGDYAYPLCDLAEDEVAPFLATRNFDGVNVTIPYKKTVMPYLDEIMPEARRIGSVNTILKTPDGRLIGYNTDYAGFSEMLRPYETLIRGQKVLILGSGGSSVTVRTVLEDRGVGEAVVISRSGENNYTNLGRHADAVMLVNTTPVGMFPQNGVSPLSLDGFPHLGAVLDLIYNPAKTALVLDAEERHIPTETGLTMLVAQAVAASALFTGTSPDPDALSRVRSAVAFQKQNIVLIGMPGCGKSTVGRRLADRLGRPFVDLDDEIVRAVGQPIPDYFAAHTEADFRAVESACLADVSKRSSLVIAAGGGTVIRHENRRLIRQNSLTVFLRRPLDELSTDGRPLSLEKSAEALWKERRAAYESAADVTVEVRKTPDETADAIMEVLSR